MDTQRTQLGKVAELVFKAQYNNGEDPTDMHRFIRHYDELGRGEFYTVSFDHDRDILGKVIHTDITIQTSKKFWGRLGRDIKGKRVITNEVIVIELKIGTQPLRRGATQAWRYIRQYYSLGKFDKFRAYTFNIDTGMAARTGSKSRDYLRRNQKAPKGDIVEFEFNR